MTSARSNGARPPAEFLLEERFAAGLDGLRLVRASVVAASKLCGFAELDARDIALAVDEACKNIIVHGYDGGSSDDIVLTIYRLENGIILQLRDFAPAVDPSSITPRALDDIRPGKLGTHFIRTIMDRTEFLPPPDGRGNLLQLMKHLE